MPITSKLSRPNRAMYVYRWGYPWWVGHTTLIVYAVEILTLCMKITLTPLSVAVFPTRQKMFTIVTRMKVKGRRFMFWCRALFLPPHKKHTTNRRLEIYIWDQMRPGRIGSFFGHFLLQVMVFLCKVGKRNWV